MWTGRNTTAQFDWNFNFTWVLIELYTSEVNSWNNITRCAGTTFLRPAYAFGLWVFRRVSVCVSLVANVDFLIWFSFYKSHCRLGEMQSVVWIVNEIVISSDGFFFGIVKSWSGKPSFDNNKTTTTTTTTM